MFMLRGQLTGDNGPLDSARQGNDRADPGRVRRSGTRCSNDADPAAPMGLPSSAVPNQLLDGVATHT